MARRLVALVAALALLVLPWSVAAQEVAAPVAAVPWYAQPWLASLVGVLIFVALELLKRWAWFAERVLAGPLADMSAVVLLCAGTAALRLVGGEVSLAEAAQAFSVQLGAAFGAWAVQQGLTRAAAARRDAQLLGGAS